jgi:hypothetical protein
MIDQTKPQAGRKKMRLPALSGSSCDSFWLETISRQRLQQSIPRWHGFLFSRR